MSDTKPTAAAMRAAKIIVNDANSRMEWIRKGELNQASVPEDWVGEVIDDETGLPELIAATTLAYKFMLGHKPGPTAEETQTALWNAMEKIGLVGTAKGTQNDHS